MERGSGILIGVGALIEDDAGRILLVKHVPRKGDYWQGKWICPGGALELGETIEEGIRREEMEETQLEIDLVKPLTPLDRVVKSKGKVSLHVVYIDYLAKLKRGVMKVGDDVGEAMWVKKKDLPDIWEELHEDTRWLLKLAGVV